MPRKTRHLRTSDAPLDDPRPGICWYPDHVWPEVARGLPDGGEVYAVKDSATGAPPRCSIRLEDGKLELAPLSVWSGLDPADVAGPLQEIGLSIKPTAGAVARSFASRLARGTPLYAHQGYAHRVDLVEDLCTRYWRGPLMRTLETRLSGVVLVDLRSAYLWASCQPLPYGPPYRWEGREVPENMAGVVECDVVDRHRLHGYRNDDGEVEYLERYPYRGTWAELRRGVERGRLEQVGSLRGWIFNQARDPSWWRRLRPWVLGSCGKGRKRDECPDCPEKGPCGTRAHLAKVLYTRGWVQHVWPGYWRAIVSRTEKPENPDRVYPWLNWRRVPIDPEEDPRVAHAMQRPDRSLHFLAHARSRVLDFIQDVLEAGGRVGQVLVDMVVATRDHVPASTSVGHLPGQWGVERADSWGACDDVEYAGTRPGEYRIVDAHGRTLRERHAGHSEALPWEAIDAEAREIRDSC